jgi:outer membrane protein TolC
LLLYPFTVERVRLEDARFEEALLEYEVVVLNAVREAENAMVGFLKAKDSLEIAEEGNQAASRSAELAVGAYKEGKVIVSVPLVALTFKANFEDSVIASRGAVANRLIAVYKALGGGWESHHGQELVPEEIRERMRERTDWWSFSGKRDLATAISAP